LIYLAAIITSSANIGAVAWYPESPSWRRGLPSALLLLEVCSLSQESKARAVTGVEKPLAYAFVEMDALAAERAIQALNRIEFYGQTLKVEEAEVSAF
jgi:hypothetical protein